MGWNGFIEEGQCYPLADLKRPIVSFAAPIHINHIMQAGILLFFRPCPSNWVNMKDTDAMREPSFAALEKFRFIGFVSKCCPLLEFAGFDSVDKFND